MEDAVRFVVKIAGAAIAILPLLFTVMIIKGTQGIIGAVSGKLAGSGAAKGIRKFGEDVREDRKNVRRTDALNGNAKLPGYGAGVRWSARRRAARKSREGGAQYAELNYIANTAAENAGDNKLARQMAGGDPGRQASVVASAIAQQRKAIEEGVKDMEALIRVKVDKGDVASVEEVLKKAVKDGDKTTATAAQNLLFAQGGSGVGNFRKAMKELEGEGAMNPEVADTLRSNIQEKHGQFIKGKGNDVLNWATKGGSMTDARAGKLSDNDLAGQHASTITEMVTHNEIDAEQAERILKDPRVSANLDEAKKASLQEVVRRGSGSGP